MGFKKGFLSLFLFWKISPCFRSVLKISKLNKVFKEVKFPSFGIMLWSFLLWTLLFSLIQWKVWFSFKRWEHQNFKNEELGKLHNGVLAFIIYGGKYFIMKCNWWMDYKYDISDAKQSFLCFLFSYCRKIDTTKGV